MAGRERLLMYKSREAGAYGTEARRKVIAAQRREERGKRRTNAFATRRGLDDDDDEPVVLSRQEKLKEFKRQKNEIQSKKELQKKPPFVISKISYNDSHLYKSFESAVFQAPKGIQTPSATRTLRSHAKKGKVLSVKEAIADFTSAMASTSKNSKIKISTSESKDNSELLNRTFDAPQSTPQLEVLSSIAEKSKMECDSEKCDGRTTSEVDEWATVLNPNETFSCKEIYQQTTGNKTAEQFRSLYNQAVVELNRLCEEWTLQLENELPDSISDEINVAIGYAKLLASQKLRQFGDLISEHENMNCSTELKVLSSDLDGFWNMVSYQVEDIFRKFNKLENLKQNNWQELIEKPMPIKQPTQSKGKVPKLLKAKGTSGLRTFLAQARSHARIHKDENRDPTLDKFCIQNLEKPRTMSPVVMRVTSRAKFLGSPKTPCSEARSPTHNFQQAHGEEIPSAHLVKTRTPLHINQSKNLKPIFHTPQSTKRVPKLKLMDTPDSTPLRRSLRIHQRNQI